ncbi:HAD-IA family hydrolase [Candidatus Poribacteria bacterium]|nr:HAD-IA family hydrolase [Candidatus Poribacteria bacterium]MYA57979.1 HAD-IA family hydrolase [Candidatus Poribacteria bacterium]
MPIQTIIFDFDYTLVDSARGTIDGVNYAFEKMGLPIASDAAVRRAIGLSLPDILTRLAGDAYVKRVDEFTHLFLQRADETMVALAEFYAEVPQTVKALQGLGIHLAIVSQKLRRYIQLILEKENLLEAFEVIVGGRDAPYKPDPEGLLSAVAQTGSIPENCLYVGDSVTDAETARRAEIAFVAVLSGVTPRTAFESYDVYAILEDVSRLLSLESVRRLQ